ncbi:MAG: universal stress protein [Candidatus Binatia bacterium]
MFSKIIVPLDGSKAAEVALPYARSLAGKLHLDIELIAAVDVTELARSVSAAEGLFLDRVADDESRRLREYLSAIASSFAGVEVGCRVDKGPAADVIINAAAQPETLINMATHGRSGLNRWLLGSVAEKILRAASGPLLLVRAAMQAASAGRATLKSIIAPLDGSQLAEQALPAVIDLARRLDIEVILFRAYAVPSAAFAGAKSYSLDTDRLVAEMAAAATEYLRGESEMLKQAGVKKVNCVAKEGLSADEILKFAREKPDSLIAMCAHGRSGIKRWVLGSVTETVVRHANAPVLIVRGS